MGQRMAKVAFAYHERKVVKIALLVTALGLLGVWMWYNISQYLRVKHITTAIQHRLEEQKNHISNLMATYLMYGQERAKLAAVHDAFIQFATPQSADKLASLQISLAAILEELTSQENAESTMLISKDGRIFFANFATEYVGKNITDSVYATSALCQSYIRALMTQTYDIAEFSYDPVLNTPQLYISIPVFKEGLFLGILIQRVPTEKIYTIADNYIGLGSTGDIMMAKMVPDGIIVMSRMRLEHIQPFKKFIPMQQGAMMQFPMRKALAGMHGVGIVEDFNNKEVIAAWDYIPKVNWGLEAQISKQEVINYGNYILSILHYLCLLFVFILFICAYHYSWFSLLYTSLCSISHRHLKYALIALLLLFFGALCMVGINFAQASRAEFQKIASTIQDDIASVAQDVERKIVFLESIGQQFSYDMSLGNVPKDGIKPYVEQFLKHHPEIIGITVAYAPFAYEPTKRLYAPDVIKKPDGSIVWLQLEDVYDYTVEIPLLGNGWRWFEKPMQRNGVVWFDPYVDQGHLLTGYSVPFYAPLDKDHQQPIGVILFLFDTSDIAKLVNDYTIGKTGFAYLVAENGAYVSYPIAYYVMTQRTIFDVAKEQSNADFLEIVQRAMKGKEEFTSYQDTKTGDYKWNYFKTITRNHWVVAGTFSAREMSLPNLTKRHYSMLLLLCIIMIALIGSLLFYPSIMHNIRSFSRLLTIVLAFSSLMLLIIVWWTPPFDSSHDVILDSPTGVNSIVEDKTIIAQRTHEPIPTVVPVGIYIHSIVFPTPGMLELSGIIWAKYPIKLDPKLRKPIYFVGEFEPAKIEQLFEHEQKDQVVIGWKFNVKLVQKFNLAQYPLDAVSINLALEYPDMSKNIVLVPSLVDYHELLPEEVPGFEDIELPGYSIKKSFFALSQPQQEVTFGLPNSADNYDLSYKMEFVRNLMFDIIVFGLPLLIIFIVLFATFIMAEYEEKALSVLSAYAALIFVVTLLHRSLREGQITSQVLYPEYFFFILYVTFGILIVHTLSRLYKGRYESTIKNIFYYFRVFYWPLQLSMIFIITLRVFYGL